NCDALPFSPTLSVTLGAGPTTRAPAFTTTIRQDNGEAGLKRAEVLLSNNVGPNLDAMSHPCKLIQFRVNPSACPANSIVGRASANPPFASGGAEQPVC